MSYNGMMPFGFEIQKVGPFVATQLNFVFLINAVILLADLVMLWRENRAIHEGYVFSLAAIYLCALYGALLGNILSIEAAVDLFTKRSVIVIAESLATLIVIICIGRRKEG